MFDLTDSDTLERVRTWVTELQTLVGADIVLTVVANKADLAAARTVPAAEPRAVAAAVGASYFEVSALTGGPPSSRHAYSWAITLRVVGSQRGVAAAVVACQGLCADGREPT